MPTDLAFKSVQARNWFRTKANYLAFESVGLQFRSHALFSSWGRAWHEPTSWELWFSLLQAHTSQCKFWSCKWTIDANQEWTFQSGFHPHASEEKRHSGEEISCTPSKLGIMDSTSSLQWSSHSVDWSVRECMERNGHSQYAKRTSVVCGTFSVLQSATVLSFSWTPSSFRNMYCDIFKPQADSCTMRVQQGHWACFMLVSGYSKPS